MKMEEAKTRKPIDATKPDARCEGKHRFYPKVSCSSFHLAIAFWGDEKGQNAPRVMEWETTIAILPLRSASLALAEHFKTIKWEGI